MTKIFSDAVLTSSAVSVVVNMNKKKPFTNVKKLKQDKFRDIT